MFFTEEAMAAEYDYPTHRLSPDNTATLLVDHQTGLIVGVQDHDQNELSRNALALARAGKVFGVPVVASSSAQTGPNGPLLPELVADLPEGTPIIHRTGEVDAFDDPRFDDAVRAADRPNLVIAGVITDVCLMFASLSARARGYNVHAVIDASGTTNKLARETSIVRLAAAGVVVNSTVAVLSELLRDWKTPGGPGTAEIFGRLAMPFYGAVSASHAAAGRGER
ncbi:Nicotinamidase-related amidase [Sinosporangium album]|uniref:Nicotinamidase-related amidase n=1 Tax=Sinosporangium album TaxID=504805 RepID=A0A1G7XGX9_9ACTN|nr:isochorismatase family protein [Sinosporangium album]SDG83545.1 Nicotinamidase-related amidase [Sinosporangium album]